jgi:aquaporin Z
MEGAEIGVLILVAAGLTLLFESPSSSVHHAIHSALARRALMALAIGVTVGALIYSPFGRRSGAHFNPAVTVTFFRIGKVDRWDVVFYVAFQVAGALLGIALARLALGDRLGDPSVRYAVTDPGTAGTAVAFLAELGLSFAFMTALLVTMNRPRTANLVGAVAGTLIALFIFGEAPLSGMSMNPARTLGSAVPADDFSALWVYLIAPPLGMLLAAEAYVRLPRLPRPDSAKLLHDDRRRCIFRCERHGGRPFLGGP